MAGHCSVRRPTILAVMALLAPLALAACGEYEGAPPPDRGELTIYSSQPLQGDSKPQSVDVVLAMEMALRDHGGRAGGYPVRYVSLDDASPELGRWDPERIIANAERAAANPSTIAYLGEFNSPASVTSIPILNEAGILQVSPSNTHVGLTRSDGAPEGEPDVFYPTGERTYGRVVPADHVQAGAIVSLMKEKQCSNVFIINDDDPFYGKAIADQVARNAEDQGLEVLGNRPVDVDANSPRPLADEVKQASADCMFFGGRTLFGPEPHKAADLTRAVADANPGITMFFPDGCAELAFTEDIPAKLEPYVFLTNPTLDPDDYPEEGQAFYDEFRAEHGRDPEPYAIYGYEAMSVVLDSIERAGEAAGPTADGRKAVISAFFETRGRDSVLGTYDIDAYGDTTLASYGGYTVGGGEIAFDKAIEVVVAEPVDGPELTPIPSPEPAAATPLEGAWRGGKVTLATMRQERTEKEARFVFEANGAESHLVTTLEVTGDRWQTLVSVDGGPDQPAQAGTFTVEGDLIHMVDGPVNYTYRFELRGDTLRIGLVESDSGPAAPGISDDAFQFAHFAAPFERVPD